VLMMYYNYRLSKHINSEYQALHPAATKHLRHPIYPQSPSP